MRVEPANAVPVTSRGAKAALLFGVFAAPTAWALQLASTYALTSSSCFPREIVRAGATHALPGGIGVALTTIVAACVVLGIAGLVVSLNQRRSATNRVDASAPTSPARALAMAGVLSSVLFLAAIAYSAIVMLLVPRC